MNDICTVVAKEIRDIADIHNSQEEWHMNNINNCQGDQIYE